MAKEQKPKRLAALPLAFTAIACLMFGGASRAEDLTGAQHLVTITRGGLLYDNWYAQLGIDAPKTTYPSYPSSGKQKGASTWRCKECHGWDYKGGHGAYSKGSHFAGISGKRRASRAVICHTIIRPKRRPFQASGTRNALSLSAGPDFIEPKLALLSNITNYTAIDISSGGYRMRLLSAHC